LAQPVLALALILAVAGCGLRPLYAPPGAAASPEDKAVAAALASISVAPMLDRQGQEMRNRLTDLFRLGADGGGNGNRYVLNVGLGEIQQSLAIRQTGLATRANLFMNATYSLVDVTSGQPVVVGSTNGVASYDLLDQDFATLTAINDARSRVIARLADNIRNRLAVHFARSPAVAAGPPAPATDGVPPPLGEPVPALPPGSEVAPIAPALPPTTSGLPRSAPVPDAPSALPPVVLVPSPATEPTIASPAPTPFVPFQPAPAAEPAAPIGPPGSRPGGSGAGGLP
jgi:LPS-assembly lipoprotein